MVKKSSCSQRHRPRKGSGGGRALPVGGPVVSRDLALVLVTDVSRSVGFQWTAQGAETLAKVELPVWDFYLHESGLSPRDKLRFTRQFADQYAASLKFFHQLTGRKDPLFFRPWLSESIRLRSPMIHPLNLLQILALQGRLHGAAESRLLRETVTGIASGMMTTG